MRWGEKDADEKFKDLSAHGIYRAPLGFVNLDWLRLRQIDPPPHPARLGQGIVVRNAMLRFGLGSQSPNSQNLTGRGIAPLILLESK